MTVQTTTVTKELPTNERDSPAVLAYRVGQLEIATTKGFESMNAKLDNLANGLASKLEVKTLEDKITAQIIDIRADVDSINSKRWIQNTLSAILGAVLAILISYFLTNIGG